MTRVCGVFGGILSGVSSATLLLCCSIFVAAFTSKDADAHALYLCFALTPSSLEGLALFGLRTFVRLLRGAFLCSLAASLLCSQCECCSLTAYVHFVRRCALCSGGDYFGSVVVLRS